eukprot:1891224-Rhodomonas_salina.1
MLINTTTRPTPNEPKQATHSHQQCSQLAAMLPDPLLLLFRAALPLPMSTTQANVLPGKPQNDDEQSSQSDLSTDLSTTSSPLMLLVNAALPPISPPKTPETVAKSHRKGAVRSKNHGKHDVQLLRSWFLSHLDHPFPSEVEKHTLAFYTSMTESQVSTWFINERKRSKCRGLWKIPRQLEAQRAVKSFSPPNLKASAEQHGAGIACSAAPSLPWCTF